MNGAHERFQDWLAAGADGEPARDLAVHASVCDGCRQFIAALDQLAAVNTGLASMPAEPTGRERSRLVFAGRLMGATAVLFSAAILGVGVSQLIGVSHTNDPVAQASPSANQGVLGQTATPEPSPTAEATPSPPQETLTPLGTPIPTQRPAVTPIPRRTLAPTPVPTVAPAATPDPTVAPTATPDPTVAPTDTDLDGVSDADEVLYGSDPNNPLSTPENSLYAASTCTDSVDNDLDTFIDVDDPGCA